MKKLEPIFDKLNLLLTALFAKFGAFLSSLVPNKIKNFLSGTNKKISDRKNNAKAKIQSRIQNQKQKIDVIKEKAKSVDVQAHVKEKTEKTITWAKALTFAKISAAMSAVILFLWHKLKFLLNQVNPNFVLSSLVVGSIGTVAGIQAFKSSRTIVEEVAKEPTRVVASVPAGRASYYKGVRKQINIADLKVPMYLKKDHKDMKSLRMEFVFETTTRYSKMFIEKHEYEVRDRIFSEVEPMGAKFLLKPEGKDIIKRKIKKVLNEYLKENNLQGEVKNVSVDNIIGG